MALKIQGQTVIDDDRGLSDISQIGIGTTSNPTGAKLLVDVGSGTTAVIVQGSEGQLFSVTNELTTGSIFSVNDVSGIPSIDVDADGTILVAPYSTTEKVGFGTTSPTYKMDVVGDINFTGTLFQNGTEYTSGIASLANDTSPVLGADLDANSNNIFGINNINVSGITTLGTVQISSGIVTATSGVVTYYGDGSNLTGVAKLSGEQLYSSGNLRFADDGGIYFGTGYDMYILHLSSGGNTIRGVNQNLTIDTVISGDILIKPVGSVELYENGSKKLETRTDGIAVSGIVTATSGVVTYYGDGSQLTGIQTAGGSSSPWITSGYTGIGTTSAVGIGTIIEIIPYDTQNSGTLSFEASAGQLFSITNNLTSGSIFSVNDASGIPSIDVDADGTIQLAPFSTTEFVGIGTTNPTEKLHVNGDARITGILTVGSSSITLNGTDNSIHGYDALIAPPKRADTVNILVTVGSKTTDNRYYNQGSSNCYFLNGIEAPFLTLTPGRTYRFTLSSGDMTSHPFRLYLEADKTTAYTTNVTSTSTYTEIVVNDATPSVLHYQCSAHSLMGNSAQTNSSVPVGSAANLTALTGASSGTYGDSSNVAAITVDTNGRITGISEVTISGGGGSQEAFKTISVSGQSDVVADTATDTLTLVAGSNMTITTNATTDSITFASSGGGSSNPGIGITAIAKLVDQKSSGTDGGSVSTTNWFTRTLNTELFDPHGIVTLSSNQFTLQSGQYKITFSAPAVRVDHHICRLYNVTSASVVAYGQQAYNNDAAYYAQTSSVGTAYIDISSATTFRIDHRCKVAQTGTDALGVGDAALGVSQTYTEVLIEKFTAVADVSYSNSDVDSHLNTSSASANEVLSWNGSDYDWVAQSGGGGGGVGYFTTTTNGVNYTGIGTTSAVGIGTIIEIVPHDDQDGGTLSFEGSAGNLFSITNNLSSGSIFAVNDISGSPSIDVNADGTVLVAPYSTTEKVGIGTNNPTYKFHVVGNTNIDGTFTVNGSAVSGSYSDSSVDSHLNTSSASANEVLSWNGSDYDWVAQSGGGGGASEAFKTIAVSRSK